MAGPAPRTARERLDQAIAFLQEAVYRSRAKQADATGLTPPASAGLEGAAGQCGLGHSAAVVLDLSERGRTLFDELWPTGLQPADLERVHAVMGAWIERQDALDRKRNHFMKDFRQRLGFDRSKYDPAQLADWDAGLGAVNDDVNARLHASATELLAGHD